MITIATRNSQLAIWQANLVKQKLQEYNPDFVSKLYPLTTKGDKLLNSPLYKIGGKGLFIKELEVAIEQGIADIAIHSMKDVGTQLPKGLEIVAILPRENPFDALISNRYQSIDQLNKNSRIGTCSLRRKMQLKAFNKELNCIDLRGNLQTRLSKLDNNEFDAIILASAGLIRLDMPDRIKQIIPSDIMLPAIGQGAIGIECAIDNPLLPFISQLNHPLTDICVRAERIINSRLQGSCQTPLAAYAQIKNNQLTIKAKIGSIDGKKVIKSEEKGSLKQAYDLANKIADNMVNQGAMEIIAEIIN